MPSKLQFRRDPAATWVTNNPVLSVGEPGEETDTNYFKIGDGVTAWNALPYATHPDLVAATSSSTNNTLVKRSAASDISVGQVFSLTATPSGASSLTRKDYVDGIGSSANANNTIVRRDGNGYSAFNTVGIISAPTGAADATRKDYVDGQVATRSARQLAKNSVTASYTVVPGDATDTILHSTSATAITITLPQDTAATISQEISIPWRQYGAGQITFAAGTGATLVSRGSVFKSAGQYAEGLLTKVAANTWLLSGDIVA